MKQEYNKFTWITGKPKIGKGTWIGAFTLIDGKHAKLEIGKGCDISSGVQILTHSTVKRCVSNRKYDKIDARDTKIGNNVFIGTNAVILMGCNIGDNSIIGAGAVVKEGTIAPKNSLIIGVPAKVRKRKDVSY